MITHTCQVQGRIMIILIQTKISALRVDKLRFAIPFWIRPIALLTAESRAQRCLIRASCVGWNYSCVPFFSFFLKIGSKMWQGRRDGRRDSRSCSSNNYPRWLSRWRCSSPSYRNQQVSRRYFVSCYCWFRYALRKKRSGLLNQRRMVINEKRSKPC